jgi:predicted DNA-binding transcriptional regulator AlpA
MPTAEKLVGIFEIASMLGVSRQRVDQLSRGDGGFPAPVAELHAGRIWLRDDVIQWASHSGRKLVDPT